MGDIKQKCPYINDIGNGSIIEKALRLERNGISDGSGKRRSG
jgi:hypothetical protein